jgi:hypothetical protein
MKRAVLLIAVLALLAAALPVFAQTSLTSQQQESVQTVSDAVTAIGELDSYTMYSKQIINQQMEMGVGQQTMNIVNDITQTIDFQVVKTADGYNASGALEQSTVTDLGTGGTETVLTFEMVLLDGDTYVRVSGDAGPLAAMFPEGWSNLSDPAAAANPLLSALNVESMVGLGSQSFLTEDSAVLGIEELDSAEIDGQTMRVFDINYDTTALAASGVFDAMSSSLGSLAGPQGGDPQEMIQDMFEDAEITYTAYVGADDGLLHQLDNTMAIDATLSFQGMTLPLVMTIDSTTVFSDFNEPVEIEAPEVGT